MNRLERCAYVSVIAVSCVSLFLLIEPRFHSVSNSVKVKASPEKDLIGRRVSVPGLDSKSPEVVLLQISTTCHYCRDSVEFYRTVMSVRESTSSRIPVVVLTTEATEAMRGYLKGAEIPIDRVFHIDPSVTGTNATPTILFVSGGVVKEAYVGKLNESREKAVLSIFKS